MIDLRKHAIALHFVQPGDVVIDAGAYVGSYSLFYGKLVGRKGQIFSYEPQQLAVQLFESKIKAKKIKNIEIYNKAVSSVDGKKIPMKVYQNKLDQSCTVEPLLMNEGRMPGDTSVVLVETEKLDTLLPKMGKRKCSFLKIDTEGHEGEVLKGAKQLIASHRPFIALEYGFIPGEFEPNTIAQLQESGYTCFDLKDLQQVSPGYLSLLPTDLIAVPQEKVDVFKKVLKSLPSHPFLLKLWIGRKLGLRLLKIF